MWEYVLLGILQGLFEWLPLSSEGIVALFSQHLIKNFNSVDIALFLHLGTLFAVLVYFWKDWISLISFKDKEFLRFFIIITIVSGGLGFFVYKFARSLAVGPALLVLMGCGLLLTSFFQSKKVKLNINKDVSAFIVGILQGLSAIPGLSRSGSTMFGLSLTERDPAKILKTSYIISVPVVLGSFVYLFIKNPAMVDYAWVGILFSFVFGLLSLSVLLKLAEKINFSKFTLIFGLLCLLGALISLI